MRFYLPKYFLLALLMSFVFKGVSQGIGDFEVINPTNYTPVIKDAAVKQTDQPEIIDTVKKITDVTYAAPNVVYKTNFETSQIAPAKMVNEPLSKLYQSLIKVGFGNYTMPYVDAFLNSTRNKDMYWGVRYNHLSSYAKYGGLGRTDFADDNASIYAKKFYKKHTLSGDFNYSRNMVHFYGFNDTIKNDNGTSYKQYFQLFEGKLRLQSHYGDTGKINHDVRLNYYNYGDHYSTYENNVYGEGLFKAKVDDHKFTVLASADYYNVQSKHDTVNNFIAKVNPYGELGGKKWNAGLGTNITLDYFNTVGAKYYIAPRFNIFYDVYQSIIIPYIGMDGGITKNSYRSLSGTNPFILSSEPNQKMYKNTNNVLSGFGGLRGALSSNTSYDVKVLYGRYNNMAYFLADYNTSADNPLANRYKVIYMNTNYLNVNAQVKYQYKEKINFIAKGNYYGYSIKDTSNVKPWHKPNFDLTFSAHYNLKSKIILKADIFVIGKQWAQQQAIENNVTVLQAVQLKGITDMNLGAEYRYTKMLSFFASFNNIGNFRYYRWDKYPTQRFNFMVGLSFTPF